MSPILRDYFAAESIEGVTSFDRYEALVKFLCPHGVVIGGTYEHFKGKKYTVLGVVRDAEDWHGELLVRYVEASDSSHEAVRKLSSFLSMVGNVPRFKLCTPSQK